MQTNKYITNQADIACIDLFCGAGGLSHGLIQSGINIVSGIDADASCRDVYEINNHAEFVNQDIINVDANLLRSKWRNFPLSILAGCAPCQPFSKYSAFHSPKIYERQWNLLTYFGSYIEKLQPTIITMENVPQLTKHNVFNEFLNTLNNYFVDFQIVDCSRYGIPQKRKRLVLLASRLGPIKLQLSRYEVAKPVSVRDAISHLPSIKAGECDPFDQLHAAARLNTLNMKRIQASLPGKSWREWDESLLVNCHKKKSGSSYTSIYGRMMWDEPAPTITTQCFGYGNGRFGHPEQDRAISLREAAILQSFPETYHFISPDESPNFSRLGRLIGNAVPVRLGEIIGKSILNHINMF